MAKNRVVRIFISSTFRDMHAEREELIKRVFPQIRKMCARRGIVFIDVDLRWGISDEQKSEGKVLPICLEEIKKCRPYFIGLLGERYGWVPEEISPSLVEQEGWLKEHHHKSVTELEILHGVLLNPEMVQHAFFYLRDPAYIQTLPDEQQKDFYSESTLDIEKLSHLKEKIRASGLPVRENYLNPTALGQLVLSDLTETINQLFPVGTEQSPLDIEAEEHEAYAASRADVYTARQEDYTRLNAHAHNGEAPLVLTGEPGVGKSALLANWALEYREKNPGDHMIMHFVGSSPYSSDWIIMLRRIMEELKTRLALEQEIPSDKVKLRTAFRDLLIKAAARAKCIIILDALNHLDDTDHALELIWLPVVIPKNVRMIVSTIPGTTLEELKRRGWPIFEVNPLISQKDRKVLIQKYLGRYRKTLPSAYVEKISQARQTANPLYLRTLLEELRVFGLHGKLYDKIDDYLAAQTIPELFEKILMRYEADYETDKKGLVKESLSLIYAARKGLSEHELLALLGAGQEPLAHAVWSPLAFAMDRSLIYRCGLIGFAHDYFRQAVNTRYLSSRTEDFKYQMHLRLIAFFSDQELTPRVVDELPWHVAKIKRWDQLKNCLTHPDMFLKLSTDQRMLELMGYWLLISERFNMGVEYQQMIESNLSHPNAADFFCRVGDLLYQSGHYAYANQVFSFGLKVYEKAFGRKHPHLVGLLNSLSSVLVAQGDYSSAGFFANRALSITENNAGTEHPDTVICLNNFANILYLKGDAANAKSICQRSLDITRKLSGPEHLDTRSVLCSLANIIYAIGDYSNAESLYRQALGMTERLLGPGHPEVAVSLNNLANVLKDQGKVDEAEPLYRRALDIIDRALGGDHPALGSILNNFASLRKSQGNLKESEQLYRRALVITEKSLGPGHPDNAVGLNNLANALKDQGEYRKAEYLYRRALELVEQSLGPDHPDIIMILNNVANALRAQGNLNEAQSLYSRALVLSEREFDGCHPKVAYILNNLAAVLQSRGEHAKAEQYYRRALEIYKNKFGPEHPDAVTISENLKIVQDNLRDNV